MRRRWSMCAFLAGAIVSALMPMTASAQQTPTDQATLLTLLPGPITAVLSPLITQVENGQASGDPKEAANALEIYSKAFSAQLTAAEGNLVNDIAMTQSQNHTQAHPAAPSQDTAMKIAGDQAIIQQLLALNATVVGGS